MKAKLMSEANKDTSIKEGWGAKAYPNLHGFNLMRDHI